MATPIGSGSGGFTTGSFSQTSGATATTVIILQTGQAQIQASRFGNVLGSTATKIHKVNEAASSGSSVFNTLSKALISMMGVLIAFNVLITIPQQIILGIATAIGYAVNNFADFEQSVLSIQAILASTLKFSEDAGDNFVLAGKKAQAITRELIKEAEKTPATFQELQQGFQAMIGAGGLQYVKTWKEALQLNTLLVNSVLSLTQGMDQSRQIATELRAIFSGNVNAGSQLAIIMGLNKQRLAEILEKARQNKDLLLTMKDILSGFDEAAIQFAQSWRGVTSSIEEQGNALARKVIEPVVKFLEQEMKVWLKQWQDIESSVNEIAATLAAAILEIVKQLIKDTKKLSKDAGGIDDINATIVDIAVNFTIATTAVENLYRTLKPIFLIVKGVVQFLFFGIAHGIQQILLISAWLATYTNPLLILFGDAKKERAGIEKELVESVKKGGERIDTALKDIGTGLFDKIVIEDAAAKGEELRKAIARSSGPIFRALEKARLAGGEDLGDIEKERRRRAESEAERRRREKEAKEIDNVMKYLDQLKIKLNNLKVENEAEAKQVIDQLIRETFEAIPAGKKFASQMDTAFAMIWTRSREWIDDIKELEKKNYAEALEVLVRESIRLREEADKKAKEAADKMEEEMERRAKGLQATWKRTFGEIRQKLEMMDILMRDTSRTMELLEPSRENIFFGADPIVNTKKLKDNIVDLNYAMNDLVVEAQGLYVHMIIMSKLGMIPSQEIMEQYNESVARMNEKYLQLSVKARTATLALIENKKATMEVGFAIELLTLKMLGEDEEHLKRGAIFAAMSAVMGDLVQSFVSGERTIGQAARSIAGQFIELIGLMMIAAGQAAIISNSGMLGVFGQIFGGTMAGAWAAVALGSTLVGLGKRLQSGGGRSSGASAPSGAGAGGSPGAPAAPAYVQQSDILAQQTVAKTLVANTTAIDGLNAELSRLSKENGDVLVTRTITENPRIITRSVTSLTARSYQTSRELGGALLGESS